MRRLLPFLAAMSVLACDTGVSGTYDLVTINDQELPFTFEIFGTVTITSGSLTLSDSTYTYTMTSYQGDDPETFNESGTFTLDVVSNVIQFAPGPESGEEPIEATWDGDQITVPLDGDTFVFRRRLPPSRY
jgi:hypothetical protein